MTAAQAYQILYGTALCIIGGLVALMLVRAVKGPAVTDRLLAINMLGTLVIAAILICSAMLSESFLLDVALIYTMISFVSVLVLASVYMKDKGGRK